MTGIIDALYKRILLAAHPVGSIYQSTVETSPEELFGGTWTAIEGRFLLAAGGGYAAGSTGGEAAHTLTTSELPKISGHITAGSGSNGADARGYGAFRSVAGVFSAWDERQFARAKSEYAEMWPNETTSYASVGISIGENVAHNNMPPYLAVYAWQRTA